MEEKIETTVLLEAIFGLLPESIPPFPADHQYVVRFRA